MMKPKTRVQPPAEKEEDKSGKNMLISSLASGQRQTVDKKEMKKLTNKNYGMLPEV